MCLVIRLALELKSDLGVFNFECTCSLWVIISVGKYPKAETVSAVRPAIALDNKPTHLWNNLSTNTKKGGRSRGCPAGD